MKWLMPESASTIAPQVDNITYFIMLVSIFFFVLIVAGIIVFAIKFKRKSLDDKTSPIDTNHTLEIVWTVIPSILLAVMFVWGFQVYLTMSIPPKDAIEIKVTGQKWSWAFTYPNGAVSGSELVVPVNTPVKTLISSNDVLHSVFIPAFRIKMDALPNRYTVTWFEATKTGEFPLYCTEYCGTNHSGMLATVKVVTKAEYEQWLIEASGPAEGVSLAEYGETLYKKFACNTCHSIDGTSGQGPTWLRTFGTQRALASGESVLVDENYIRESILDPQAKISQGYAPIMPSYQGILKEKDIEAMIEFMKSLK